MNASDIALFTKKKKSSEDGRKSNDKNNKIREEIIKIILTPQADPFLTDPVHGLAWTNLRNEMVSAIQKVAKNNNREYATYSIEKKAGRSNFDFHIVYDKGSDVLEFKFGGTSLVRLPQFFNAGGNKKYHSTLYADYWYDNFFDEYLVKYGFNASDKPTKEKYLECVHANSCDKIPIFKALKERKERCNKEASKIVRRSITSFLTAYKDSTNLAEITADLQRSQKDKNFLLYEKGVFHYDRILPEELVAKSVVGIKNGNVLVIQTENPTTQLKMLLRWKNDAGILFPAWQIGMVRNVKN